MRDMTGGNDWVRLHRRRLISVPRGSATLFRVFPVVDASTVCQGVESFCLGTPLRLQSRNETGWNNIGLLVVISRNDWLFQLKLHSDWG
jgi:hypothetical protein